MEVKKKKKIWQYGGRVESLQQLSICIGIKPDCSYFGFTLSMPNRISSNPIRNFLHNSNYEVFKRRNKLKI